MIEIIQVLLLMVVEVGRLSHYLRRVLAPSKRWLGIGFLNHQVLSISISTSQEVRDPYRRNTWGSCTVVVTEDMLHRLLHHENWYLGGWKTHLFMEMMCGFFFQFPLIPHSFFSVGWLIIYIYIYFSKSAKNRKNNCFLSVGKLGGVFRGF